MSLATTYFLVVVKARLDDFGAAEERVLRVLLRVVHDVVAVRQRCLGYGNALAYARHKGPMSISSLSARQL